jgi:hypothetical protein
MGRNRPAYPQPLAYTRALSDATHSLRVPSLVGGRCRLLPPPFPGLETYIGASAIVIPYETVGETYALRFFTGRPPVDDYYYPRLQEWQRTHELEYLLDFEWLPEAALVDGMLCPLLKTPWINAPSLRSFLMARSKSGDTESLHTLATAWREMLAKMRETEFDHGDLHPDNIRVMQTGAGDVSLKLLDYDSAVCSATLEFPQAIAGSMDFQHPQRLRMVERLPCVDGFAGLVIYIAILALAFEPELWNTLQFDCKDGLFFTESDYRGSNAYSAFEPLERIPHLNGLLTVLRREIEQETQRLVSLEQLIAESSSPSLETWGWWRRVNVDADHSKTPRDIVDPSETLHHTSWGDWWNQVPAEVTEEPKNPDLAEPEIDTAVNGGMDEWWCQPPSSGATEIPNSPLAVDERSDVDPKKPPVAARVKLPPLPSVFSAPVHQSSPAVVASPKPTSTTTYGEPPIHKPAPERLRRPSTVIDLDSISIPDQHQPRVWRSFGLVAVFVIALLLVGVVLWLFGLGDL